MKRSSRLAGLLLVALSVRATAAPAMEESDPPDSKSPRPVKPPIEPRSRGSELSLQVGIAVMANAGYAYNTRVSQAGGYDLQYSGMQRALGLTLFAAGAFTLPGPLRRITVGGAINAGGPDSKSRPVLPSGTSTPFSTQSLYADMQARYARRLGWGAAFAPFIEHDIGFFHDRRVRAGYQHWGQAGAHAGSFPPGNGAPVTSYDVRLHLRSHLIRVSVNDYVSFPDDRDPGRRERRRAGLIEQWGIMAGTNRTVIVFAAIGPFWQIGR